MRASYNRGMPENDHQTNLLMKMCREGQPVAVWLVSGRRLIGRIRAFDRFTIVLEHGGAEQLVFKHAVATVGPHREKEGDPK